MMDVLSDTLKVVRLAGSLFFSARIAAPWCAESPGREVYARLLNSSAEYITVFHIMVAGTCWIAPLGRPGFSVAAGDLVIFPHADAHRLGSHPEADPSADVSQQVLRVVREGSGSGAIPHLDAGDGHEATEFVCGYLESNQRFNPLIGSLPTTLLVRSAHGAGPGEPEAGEELLERQVVRAEPGDILDSTLRHTVAEARAARPGGEAMLARLTELIYVEVLRRYMQQLPVEHAGWLAALRDPVVGAVLQLMHAHPERPWTVEELAEAVALSRSGLAQRFTDLVGESPMHYLYGWRMQVAKYLLSQTTLRVSAIAERTGYESEAAFSRAFKRAVGQPPGVWRELAS
ncbi:MAG: AraC family transcriptional regulator [Chloroflexota bacterium]|nr:MAG: AraC family transcriptional regulator [Chloroflexota bacterium]